MINLIFDGNYLFRKTFAVYRGFGPKQKLPQEVLATENQRGQFIRKVTTDFAHALQSLPGGRVVICFDRKSWRYNFYEGYKSSRVKDPEEDWGIFYDLITEYSAILEDKGFIISAIDGAEGDDLIYKWTEKFTAQGESSIVITGDGDLSQLVTGIQDPWIICWDNNSKKLKLFAEEGWQFNWLGAEKPSNDLFNLDFQSTDSKGSLRSLLNRTTLTELESDEILLEKILSGDDGDDVPSVWQVPNKKGTGVIRITGKKTEKIMTAFKEKYSGKFSDLYYRDKALDYLAGLILRVLGDVDGTKERKKVKENIQRNARLVWLTDEMLPPSLVSEMEGQIQRKMESAGYPKGTKRQFILEGTKYTFTSSLETNSNIPTGMNPLDLL